MSEHYEIISPARGEPRPDGCVGVRIRVQLSGFPSRRWSYVLAGRLVRELTGHAAVGHLRINVDDIVQGDEVVLDGVEPSEAPALGTPLLRAVDAANRAATEQRDPPRNVAQPVADAIAGQLFANAS